MTMNVSTQDVIKKVISNLYEACPPASRWPSPHTMAAEIEAALMKAASQNERRWPHAEALEAKEDAKYLPDKCNGAGLMAHVAEECGEVLAAIGKTQRFGLLSWDPRVPVPERETNAAWLAREMRDLTGAIERLQRGLKETGYDV